MKHFLIISLFLVLGLMLSSCNKDNRGESNLPDDDDVGVIINGIRWSTRNLESHGRFTARPEDFGGYFQWGRMGDGHENPNSGTTTILSSTDVPHHSNFIISTEEPWDWRYPQNDSLWGTIKTDFDPCPCGWRLPTNDELFDLFTNWEDPPDWGELHGVSGFFFYSKKQRIFLPAAGKRNVDGSLNNVGINGYFWSSNSINTSGYYAGFNSSTRFGGGTKRGYGFSVRCVSDQ